MDIFCNHRQLTFLALTYSNDSMDYQLHYFRLVLHAAEHRYCYGTTCVHMYGFILGDTVSFCEASV